MRQNNVLSIDLGTSSCKLVLFDENNGVVGSVSREYKTNYRINNGVDQHPKDWWNAIRDSAKELFSVVAAPSYNIVAIGIDTQSSAMIPVSTRGEVLFPALIWTDGRATAEKVWIDKHLGQETINRINGNENNESNVAAKAMWFRNNFAELYKETYQILNAAGYIVYKLTGKFSSNISEGGLSQLFDIEQGEWSAELIKGCQLDINKFPRIYNCSDVVGGLSKEAAIALGITEGIPVVAGSMDVVACALGCGVVNSGEAFISGGTVTAIGVCEDKPIKNKDLHVYHHIVPGKWCNVAGADFGGGSLRWYKQSFMGDAPDAYENMDTLAEQTPAGADKLLCISSLVGQRCPQWDPNMRGLFFGITPEHSQGHFIRALMEGNAFAIRQIGELLERDGAAIQKIIIAGGIAKSQIWMKIFRDVLDRPLYLAQLDEATSLGNMINAARGVQLLDEYVPKQRAQLEEVEFSSENHKVYNKLFSVYKELYPTLKKQYEMLANVEL